MSGAAAAPLDGSFYPWSCSAKRVGRGEAAGSISWDPRFDLKEATRQLDAEIRKPEKEVDPFSGWLKSQPELKSPLKFFEELTRRAGNINPAQYAALAILHSLDNASRLAALGTVCALAGVHHFLAVRCFCDFRSNCHSSFLLIRLRSSMRQIPHSSWWMGCCRNPDS